MLAADEGVEDRVHHGGSLDVRGDLHGFPRPAAGEQQRVCPGRAGVADGEIARLLAVLSEDDLAETATLQTLDWRGVQIELAVHAHALRGADIVVELLDRVVREPFDVKVAAAAPRGDRLELRAPAALPNWAKLPSGCTSSSTVRTRVRLCPLSERTTWTIARLSWSGTTRRVVSRVPLPSSLEPRMSKGVPTLSQLPVGVDPPDPPDPPAPPRARAAGVRRRGRGAAGAGGEVARHRRAREGQEREPEGREDESDRDHRPFVAARLPPRQRGYRESGSSYAAIPRAAEA